MASLTADFTIREYRKAYEAANGSVAPEVVYVHGWFRFRQHGCEWFDLYRKRERELIAMTERLLERTAARAAVQQEGKITAITESVVTGETRLIYDQTCSALLADMDQKLHEAEDKAEGEVKSLVAAAHHSLHALCERLVDNEIRVAGGQP